MAASSFFWDLQESCPPRSLLILAPSVCCGFDSHSPCKLQSSAFAAGMLLQLHFCSSLVTVFLVLVVQNRGVVSKYKFVFSSSFLSAAFCIFFSFLVDFVISRLLYIKRSSHCTGLITRKEC
jgi:hypothetical protein